MQGWGGEEDETGIQVREINNFIKLTLKKKKTDKRAGQQADGR